MKGRCTMKKALVIANMMFASATVFGTMPNDGRGRQIDNYCSAFNMDDIRREVKEIETIETKLKVEDYTEIRQTDNIQLMTAIENNDFKKVKKIINRHIDKSAVLDLVLAYKNSQKRNEKISHDQFALYHKHVFQNSDVFELVNFSNKLGITPILMAICRNNLKIVNFLVEHGANVDQAIEDWLIVTQWLENDRVAYYPTKQGTTLLMIAIMFENRTLVKYLIEHGADVNKANKNGLTPLYMAAERGYEDIVKYLISHGADIDKAENNGITPLIMSAHNGYENIVKCLVEHGADINKQDRYERTPLIMAMDSENIVKYLIERGADVNKEWEGEPPLLQACRRGDENIVECLVEHGAYVSDDALFCACISKSETNENVVKYLVKHGANINRENRFGQTPLFRASVFGNENIVRYLIECGADVDKEDYFGETSLFGVCEFGDENIVKYLVEHGANVNKRDRNGRTPLSIAKRKGFDSIVKYLSQHGAIE